MKRIVFCFDGTGNALNAATPTNVVLTAASVNRKDKLDVSQVIYYDEGVGTGTFDSQTDFFNKLLSKINRFIGGGLGWGVTENIREAYRFLIFNYDPGDEIFVFGFSRGAFTARSFIGLVHLVGPIRRLHASRIDEALDLYHGRVKTEDGASQKLQAFRAAYSSNVLIDESDENFRINFVPGYVPGSASKMTIKYLGVWDTVSALGAPEAVPGSTKVNCNFRFHDPSINSFIQNARHAVAIDERRVLFPPVLFGDLTELNRARNFDTEHSDAPYQERWFPGVHGSVGGGGDIRGLSDGALEWILFGAKQAGLSLDISNDTRIFGICPDPYAPLSNTKVPKLGFLELTLYQWRADRKGPDKFCQLSTSTIRRWKAEASKLSGNLLYRSKTLEKLTAELEQYQQPATTEKFELLDLHIVEAGDTLYELAHHYYSDRTKFGLIFSANRDVLDDSRQLSVGQELRIPKIAKSNFDVISEEV